jgi:transcriptional regulator with XRE-family HTH domain
MTPEEIRKQIGRNIAEVRRDAGLSQAKLGLRLELASQEISRLECGRRSVPSLTTLLPVAQALEVPLTDLLRGIE